MFKPRIAILLLGTMLTALGEAPVSAQPAAGTIAGTVKTSAGSAVAGAPIAVTDQASHATRVVRTNASGVFEAAGLAPGVYQVTADTQGFRLAVRKDVAVASGDRVVVDFTLEFRFAAETKVTAMKREDTVESTPVSVAAPTEDNLRDRGAETIEDVAANVAGFSVQNLGPGQSQVAMRGVSSGQIARDQPGVKEQVGAYLDESVISMSLFTPDLDFVDTSRVEVLRGPQGTLFGSGSLSGTVRYITNQPELGLTKAFAELSGATTTHGSQSGSAKAGFNVPLGDQAALRTAVYYDHSPGYMNAVQPDLKRQERRSTEAIAWACARPSSSPRATTSRSSPASSTRRPRRTAGTASTSSTSSATRTRRRGRRCSSTTASSSLRSRSPTRTSSFSPT